MVQFLLEKGGFTKKQKTPNGAWPELQRIDDMGLTQATGTHMKVTNPSADVGLRSAGGSAVCSSPRRSYGTRCPDTPQMMRSGAALMSLSREFHVLIPPQVDGNPGLGFCFRGN